MSAIAWTWMAVAGWLAAAVVVSLVAGQVIRRRDEQVPRSPDELPPVPAGRAEAVEDDGEQVAGSFVELGCVEAGQVADQCHHIASVDVGADRASGATGVE
jgi:hypothetical protein